MKDQTKEFEVNNGWSSSKFYPLFPLFKTELITLNITFIVGRTVAHITTKQGVLKLYPHYKGRSKEVLTLLDPNGNDVLDFHYKRELSVLIDKIKSYNV